MDYGTIACFFSHSTLSTIHWFLILVIFFPTQIILLFAFGIDDLTTTKHSVVEGVLVLLFLYGPAAAAFTYCTSFLFSSPAYCNVLNIVFGFLIGMCLRAMTLLVFAWFVFLQVI